MLRAFSVSTLGGSKLRSSCYTESALTAGCLPSPRHITLLALELLTLALSPVKQQALGMLLLGIHSSVHLRVHSRGGGLRRGVDRSCPSPKEECRRPDRSVSYCQFPQKLLQEVSLVTISSTTQQLLSPEGSNFFLVGKALQRDSDIC